MDAVERLTLEAVSAHSLIAVEHLHRYELAAELCAGSRVIDVGCGTGYGAGILSKSCPFVVGIDNDVATIDTAQATVGREHDVAFEVGDAHKVLAQPLGDRFDAIVLFETLEHLSRPEEVVASLRHRAGDGVKILVSIPNEKALVEKNPYHVSTYGYEDAIELASELNDAALLLQFLAEGSMIRGYDADGNDLGRIVATERGEHEYANHFIICANFDDMTSLQEAVARIHVEAAPLHNRYVHNLERANAELRRTNARLARKTLGIADSAGASLLAKLEATQSELESVLRAEQERNAAEEAEAARVHSVAVLHAEIADLNATIAMMQGTRVWRLGGTWWRIRDRLLRRA